MDAGILSESQAAFYDSDGKILDERKCQGKAYQGEN